MCCSDNDVENKHLEMQELLTQNKTSFLLTILTSVIEKKQLKAYPRIKAYLENINTRVKNYETNRRSII
jgi:hypothetical protein